jgi:hypothetical protein
MLEVPVARCASFEYIRKEHKTYTTEAGTEQNRSEKEKKRKKRKKREDIDQFRREGRHVFLWRRYCSKRKCHESLHMAKVKVADGIAD